MATNQMERIRDFGPSDEPSNSGVRVASAICQNNEEEGIFDIENVPDPPLLKILLELDAVTTCNLKATSKTMQTRIAENLHGKIGGKYWTKWCQNWKSDPLLVTVVASYDGRVERHRRNQEDFFSGLDFSFAQAFQSANDLVTILRSRSCKMVQMDHLMDLIKSDISAVYPKDKQSYRHPIRLTGTCGGLAFNAIRMAQKSAMVNIYEGQKCRRRINVPQGLLSYARRMTLIPESYSGSLEKLPTVSSVLVAVDLDSKVCICPLQEGQFSQLDVEAYSCEPAFKSEPEIAVHENYLAVWEDPFWVRLYNLQVDNEGKVTHERGVVFMETETDVDKLTPDIVWIKKQEEKFVLTLEPIEQVNELAEQFFNLVVTFPLAKAYVMELREGHIVTKEKALTYFPSSFPELNSSLRPKYVYTSNAHGLKILWTNEILGLCQHGFTWHFRRWNALMTDRVTDDDLVEAIAPNIIAIVSNGTLKLALVHLQDLSSAKRSTHDPLRLPWITFEVLRRINLQMPPNLYEIRHFRMDYDKGMPYFWFEADHIADSRRPESMKWRNSPLSFVLSKLVFE